MNSRDRIFAALEHKEADMIPCDLAGTHVTGIHVAAYRNLCSYLEIDPEPLQFTDVVQQIVMPKQEILDRFSVDTRGLFPLCSHNWNVHGSDAGDFYEYIDEWGFTYHMPRNNGRYWSLIKSPMDCVTADSVAINTYKWPAADDPRRITGLRKQAMDYRSQGKIVIMKGFCAGLFEMAQRVRGMGNFLCDLVINHDVAGILLDKLLELKKRFWAMVFKELGDVVDIVVETDDYGTQESQLISYDTFKDMIYPRLRNLIQFIKSELTEKKANGEKGYIFFHSCGNVRPFIPDFIDMGIDIINPVHVTAAGMEPAALKKDFGKYITFWGGGVDTQNILPFGTATEVCQYVKENLKLLKPGGGYVFNPVHNIQAEVPPENIIAMYETLQQYGKY
jgi:uroporphyrinogen decarboxylase